MGSFQHVPSNPATADKKRGRSVLCDNPLGKPSRQRPPWAAHFSQYRNCAFPVMPTELKPFRHSSIVQDSYWCRRSVTSLLRDKSMSKHGQSFLESPSHKWNGSVPNNIPTGAAPLCQNAGIYVTLFLSQSIQWWTSQWASSIFTAFHALMSNHKRTLRCNRKLETPSLKDARKTRRFKPPIMINAAKTKWHKPVRAAVPVKTSSGGRAHDMRNKLEWHTHRLECNSDFSAEMSTFCCPWTRWAF